MPLHDAVYYQAIQTALQKANPSGLPSNLVIQQFTAPTDDAGVADLVQAILTQYGYGYGWGEWVAIAGAGTYSITQPYAAAWLLRLDAQQSTGNTVSMTATVGSSTQNAVTMLDPAQTLMYGDMFRWSPAVPLGRVGIAPWGTPSGWTDPNAVWMGPLAGAASSAPVGQWLLRKWLYVGSATTATVALASAGTANLFLDGSLVVASSSYTSTAAASVNLTAGLHLLSVSCIRTGAAPAPTGILLSIANASGAVIEDGQYSPAVGPTWETSGYINPVWTTVNGPSDLRYSWGVIPASQITSESITLTLTVTGSPLIHGVWWYSVAPWRWDQGNLYDQQAVTTPPATTPPTTTVEVVG